MSAPSVRARRHSTAPIALAAALLLGTAPAAAQVDGGSPWREAWSPLLPLADLVHALPAAPRSPGLLSAPAPRSGMHWTAGNPAGLAWEIDVPRQEFLARHARTEGEYRRPLDPASVSTTEIGGLAWEPLDGAGALLGRLSAARLALGEGSLANTALPYTSSPHVVMDTSGAALRQTVARLEGAGGWRLGGWGAGLALGYETLDTRTEGAAVARAFRFTRPALSAGLARELGPLRLGLHGRWQGGSQTTQLAPRRGLSILRVYPIEGYTDPRALEFDQGFYHRITQRRASAVGASLAGQTGPARWALFAERAALREEQTSQLANEPPLDVWEAAGGSAGLGLELALGGPLWLALDARYQWLGGEAIRAALPQEGILYDADESRAAATAELRYLPAPAWQTAARLSLERGEHRRDDHVSRLNSELAGWTYGGTLEVARELGGGLAVAAAAGASRYVPFGSLPDPRFAGLSFRSHVAPALMQAGMPASAVAGSLTLRWQRPAAESVWLHVGYAATSADFTSYRLQLAPEGERSGWEVALGVLLR